MIRDLGLRQRRSVTRCRQSAGTHADADRHRQTQTDTDTGADTPPREGSVLASAIVITQGPCSARSILKRRERERRVLLSGTAARPTSRPDAFSFRIGMTSPGSETEARTATRHTGTVPRRIEPRRDERELPLLRHTHNDSSARNSGFDRDRNWRIPEWPGRAGPVTLPISQFPIFVFSSVVPLSFIPCRFPSFIF